MRLQDALDGDEFGVSRAAEGAVGVVHAVCEDGRVVDEDAADGDFAAEEGEFGLGEGLLHECFVECARGGGHGGGEGGGEVEVRGGGREGRREVEEGARRGRRGRAPRESDAPARPGK